MAQHGGDLRSLAEACGRRPEEILDFSASINPLGPPACLRPVLSRHVTALCHYPDPWARDLRQALARRFGGDPMLFLPANGSTEILHALPRALAVRRVVILPPCYGDYAAAAQLAGLPVVEVPLAAPGFRPDLSRLQALLRPGDLVFLGRPNNPTGTLADDDALLACLSRHPEVWWAVDESFAGFVAGLPSLVGNPAPNLLVVQSLTKLYAIPGLRLGFAWHGEPKNLARLAAHLPPWSVNTLAQVAGAAILADFDYLHRSQEILPRLREELACGLAALPGVTVHPGLANFLFLRLDPPAVPANEVAQILLTQHGIAVRSCANFPGFVDAAATLRVAVRDRDDNTRLLAALGKIFAPARTRHPSAPRPRPFALMVQGTSSNAGKSVITAALCRILLQEGLAVAPFKAQNMSLNSFVTQDGLEMGRAQVVQAQACRLDPDVRMNPVLLKPASDVGSQVIVMGRPVGNMSVEEYVAYKETAWQAARAAYDSLATEHDGVVIEGAGSPGEVNLKRHDIVNMRMAAYARAPVLLVGDIDRGGIFASFVGTMEVLEEWERRLVAGFVVNRFRGRAALLDDAYRYLEAHTGKPVLGMIPFLRDLGLPEEDSVGFKAGLFTAPPPDLPHVVVALLDLPHISNFTDFEPFLGEPDLHLVVVRDSLTLRRLGTVDAIVLPGSKNVVADMGYLEKSGLAAAVVEVAATGQTEIVGICGGFQLLGRRINDPHGLESAGSAVEGLGILNLTTVLAPEKTLVRRNARHLPSGLAVHGYEIHHGQSAGPLPPCLTLDGGGHDGAMGADGMVWGCYLHGIFDDDRFRRWFVDRLRRRRGLAPLVAVQYAYDLEPALDRLADAVRQGLDMPRLFALIGR